MRFLTFFRIVAGFGTLVFFTPFALLTLTRQVQRGYDPIEARAGFVVATLATLCWWFALRGKVAESRAQMKMAFIGGMVCFVLGFAGGFLGPIIFTPQSNQGPLIGIFVTGPIGFGVGTILGWIYAVVRQVAHKQ
jgi:hypothetical protein